MVDMRLPTVGRTDLVALTRRRNSGRPGSQQLTRGRYMATNRVNVGRSGLRHQTRLTGALATGAGGDRGQPPATGGLVPRGVQTRSTRWAVGPWSVRRGDCRELSAPRDHRKRGVPRRSWTLHA